MSYIIPFDPCSVLPNPYVAAIVGLFGIDIMLDWLWRSKRLVSSMEYGLIWASFSLVMFFAGLGSFGVIEGMVASTICAALLFAWLYSRRDVFKELTNKDSSVFRKFNERMALQKNRDSLFVVNFSGYVFFGSCMRITTELPETILKRGIVVDEVEGNNTGTGFPDDTSNTKNQNYTTPQGNSNRPITSIAEENPADGMLRRVTSHTSQSGNSTNRPVKYVILDFSAVTDIDSTAAVALASMKVTLTANNILVFISGLEGRPTLRRLLVNNGVLSEDVHVTIPTVEQSPDEENPPNTVRSNPGTILANREEFMILDDALQHCEELILDEVLPLSELQRRYSPARMLSLEQILEDYFMYELETTTTEAGVDGSGEQPFEMLVGDHSRLSDTPPPFLTPASNANSSDAPFKGNSSLGNGSDNNITFGGNTMESRKSQTGFDGQKTAEFGLGLNRNSSASQESTSHGKPGLSSGLYGINSVENVAVVESLNGSTGGKPEIVITDLDSGNEGVSGLRPNSTLSSQQTPGSQHAQNKNGLLMKHMMNSTSAQHQQTNTSSKDSSFKAVVSSANLANSHDRELFRENIHQLALQAKYLWLPRGEILFKHNEVCRSVYFVGLGTIKTSSWQVFDEKNIADISRRTRHLSMDSFSAHGSKNTSKNPSKHNMENESPSPTNNFVQSVFNTAMATFSGSSEPNAQKNSTTMNWGQVTPINSRVTTRQGAVLGNTAFAYPKLHMTYGYDAFAGENGCGVYQYTRSTVRKMEQEKPHLAILLQKVFLQEICGEVIKTMENFEGIM